MKIEEQIEAYFASQSEAKQGDLQLLHERIVQLLPNGKLWFTDGKNKDGKVVANPNVGYGSYAMKYADGSTREFYQVGLSANTAGISVYIMGLEDKSYLANTFGATLGKAKVTGYCIKFKALKDIDLDVLLAAIQSRFNSQN